MGIPEHFTCLLRNLYAGQEATVRTSMKQWTGSKLGKEYIKAVYCHPAYLTSMQSVSCKMLGWMNHKLKSRLPGKMATTSDIQMTYHYNDRKQRGTEEPLDEGERGEWKSWLKTQHSKNSSPITSWRIDGEKVETVTNFIFLGSRITVNADCSHEIKTLASLKESCDKPRQHIKNQRHYFANKGPSSQSYGFSSVMYGCESWTHLSTEGS